ncbi:MAG: aminotransferase class V-fold PLP-dependent enzyme [Sandaracinaceae bacterium]
MSPDALRPHYSRFLAEDRVLLTGHSHQAWPDVAREGVLEAFDDAARLVDDKWGAASDAADAIRAAVAAQWNDAPDRIALGQSTHELVTRFLSALPLSERPRIVTTRGEFHSMRRQLARLAEVGLEVVWVDPSPLDSLAERLAAAIDERTSALMCSTVLFETASVVPGLHEAARIAHERGAEVLLDAYHQFNVVPFDLVSFDVPVFATAGGYKYAQWGEGCCFLRVPPHCTLSPVYTGWFAEFATLGDKDASDRVRYGVRGADRFAGSTYDPVSHYRARRVIRFFEERGLDVGTLRAISLRQTDRLFAGLEGFEILTPREPDQRGGFVSVRTPRAGELVTRLRERGVYVDARGDLLRFGPAPYVTDDEIDRALASFRALA